ncbi:MAG TPA: zinc-ribbon domain-containing protein, partial [Verrucomicrobiae bacterium]
FCSSKRLHSSNCAAKKYPKLLDWWHKKKNGSLTLFDVIPNSHKKVWWICPEGHEFQRATADRIRAKFCPICTNKEVHPSNCLAKVCPDLAREWHPSKNAKLTPHDVVAGSSRKIWWKCKKCHNEWRATPENRKYGKGCPVCGIKRIWQLRRQRFGLSGGAKSASKNKA